MKKKILIVLCLILLLFSSCEMSSMVEGTGGSGNGTTVDTRVPSWLRGKTWKGNVTVSVGGYSNTQYMTFSFDDGGKLSSSEIPSGFKVSFTGSGSSYTINVSGTQSEYVDGVGTMTVDVEGGYTFTKKSSNTCSISGSVNSSTEGVTVTVRISGTLRAN